MISFISILLNLERQSWTKILTKSQHFAITFNSHIRSSTKWRGKFVYFLDKIRRNQISRKWKSLEENYESFGRWALSYELPLRANNQVKFIHSLEYNPSGKNCPSISSRSESTGKVRSSKRQIVARGGFRPKIWKKWLGMSETKVQTFTDDFPRSCFRFERGSVAGRNSV